MNTGELRSTVYLDIETFASWDKPALEGVALDGRLSDPVKIKADKEKKEGLALHNQDVAWRKQALDSINGQVWCVGVAINDEPAYCLIGESEETTLMQLDEELQKHSFPIIVGHNVIEFDALFLFHRGLKYGLLNVVSAFAYKSGLRDTMVMLKGPAYRNYTSLNNAAKLLGIEGKGGMDGSMVHDLVVQKRSQEICDYCCADVELTRKVYLILDRYGLS